VDRATYDAIKGEYLDRLKALLPLDGVYMPMHGALAVEDARTPRATGMPPPAPWWGRRDPVGQRRPAWQYE
jgi:hypothetical protein